MLKRVQHDKKKYVIPNLFRNLEFGNDNKLIAFELIIVYFRTKFIRLDKERREKGCPATTTDARNVRRNLLPCSASASTKPGRRNAQNVVEKN